MSEQAIKIEGFDELTHLPVRIQLTLVTNDDPRGGGVATGFAAPRSGVVATGFAAPRGFLPEQARPAAQAGTAHPTVPSGDRAQRSRHNGLTSCQTQVGGGGAGHGDVAQ